MKTAEIRQLPDTEIRSEIEKRRGEIFRLRLRAGSQDVENPGALRRIRREIARFLTILHERARAEVKKHG
jgi:large subunit ribosomal protein L29